MFSFDEREGKMLLLDSVWRQTVFSLGTIKRKQLKLNK